MGGTRLPDKQPSRIPWFISTRDGAKFSSLKLSQGIRASPPMAKKTARENDPWLFMFFID